MLDNVGLEAALSQYVEEWSKENNIQADFASNAHGSTPSSVENRLTSERATALYRVVQEAPTNVVRHAESSSASVVLEQNSHFLSAIIEDDGRGFDVEASPTPSASASGACKIAWNSSVAASK